MPKLKTLEPASTGNVLFPDAEMRQSLPRTGGGQFRTMNKTHVLNALTVYLRSMSLIDDNEEVTNFNKAPDSLDVKIEKI